MTKRSREILWALAETGVGVVLLSAIAYAAIQFRAVDANAIAIKENGDADKLFKAQVLEEFKALEVDRSRRREEILMDLYLIKGALGIEAKKPKGK